MNLKERGITVGDLIIAIIFIISTIIIVNKIKDGNRQSSFQGVGTTISIAEKY